MLSATRVDTAAYSVILDAIKKPLIDPLPFGHYKINLNIDLSDEQLIEIAKIMAETRAAWRSGIDLTRYTNYEMKYGRVNIDNLAFDLQTNFHKLQLKWELIIAYPFQSNALIDFLALQIEQDSLHSVRILFDLFEQDVVDLPMWNAKSEKFCELILDSTIPIDRISLLPLHNNLLGEEALSVIFKKLETNTTVNQLNIQLSESEAKEFAASLRSNNTLSMLDLSNSHLNQETVKLLLQALIDNPNSNVTSLILNDNAIGDELVETFKALLTALRKLSVLQLNHTGIGSNTCSAIAESLKTNTSIKTLYMSDNTFDDNSLLALSNAMLINHTLSELDILSYNYYSPDVLTYFIDCFNLNITLQDLQVHTYNSIYNPGELNFCHSADKRIENIVERNKTVKSYREIKDRINYTAAVIVLYQAYHKDNNKHGMIAISLELVLSYLINPAIKTKLHRNLISENIQNKKWITFKEISLPSQEPSINAPALFKYTLFKKRDDAHLNVLATIAKIKENQLSEINMEASYSDWSLVEKFAHALKENTGVTKLNLSCCSLEDGELMVITDAIIARATVITDLDISLNNLSSKSASAVEKLIASRKVTNIKIYNNGMLSDNSEIVTKLEEFANTHQAVINAKTAPLAASSFSALK